MTRRWGWIFVLVLLVPLEARANVPTPLMWLTVFQLLVGNALIGVGEGLAAAPIFLLRSVRSDCGSMASV